MAVIKKDNSYMEFPLQISRQYGAPIDKYSVFYDLQSAKTYATTNPLAYVGQIITVVDESNSSAVAYLIKDTAGNLEEVGTGSSAPMLFVEDQAEMLALEDIEAGQQVYRNDTHTVWIFKGGDATQISNWVESAGQNDTVWQGTENRVNFYALEKSSYDAIESKDPNTLYFVTNVGTIYKGTSNVTAAVLVIDTDSFPPVSVAVKDKLYLSSTTLEAKVLNSTGDAWITFTPGYLTDGANWADADSGKFATIGLIKKGITEALTNTLASMGTGSADVVVTATAEGGVQRSTAKIGGATISSTADANTLATEAAVKNALSWNDIDE